MTPSADTPAAPAPAAPPPIPVGEAHALFRFGAHRFALPINEVQEVVGSLEITPVPRAGAGWLGVGNLRGEIVPAATLAPWFPAPPTPPGSSVFYAGKKTAGSIFLIIQTGSGKLALAADGFEHVTAIPREAIEPWPADGAALPPDFVPARWQPPGHPQVVGCLDAKRLGAQLRSAVVAAGSELLS
ncbi:MAG: chemotaxis protein CheW [Verrucomicrobia bacterium]|nr:chemotaxis protein CheW [Verrucomicrobiota bacterium]